MQSKKTGSSNDPRAEHEPQFLVPPGTEPSLAQVPVPSLQSSNSNSRFGFQKDRPDISCTEPQIPDTAPHTSTQPDARRNRTSTEATRVVNNLPVIDPSLLPYSQQAQQPAGYRSAPSKSGAAGPAPTPIQNDAAKAKATNRRSREDRDRGGVDEEYEGQGRAGNNNGDDHNKDDEDESESDRSESDESNESDESDESDEDDHDKDDNDNDHHDDTMNNYDYNDDLGGGGNGDSGYHTDNDRMDYFDSGDHAVLQGDQVPMDLDIGIMLILCLQID
jgi:hypothetical protein